MGFVGIGGLKKQKRNTGVTQTTIIESSNHLQGWGVKEELGVDLELKASGGGYCLDVADASVSVRKHWWLSLGLRAYADWEKQFLLLVPLLVV